MDQVKIRVHDVAKNLIVILKLEPEELVGVLYEVVREHALLSKDGKLFKLKKYIPVGENTKALADDELRANRDIEASDQFIDPNEGYKFLSDLLPPGPPNIGDENWMRYVHLLYVTEDYMERFDTSPEMIQTRQAKQARERLDKSIRALPSPSEGVKSPKKLQDVLGENYILDGRLPGHHGLSPSLYNPILAQLEHDLTNIKLNSAPPGHEIRLAHQFVEVASTIYANEDARQTEIVKIFQELLPEGRLLEKRSLSVSRARPDVRWTRSMLLEIKNECGLGGNGFTQCILSAALLFVEPKSKTVDSCDPIILIALSGNRLEIGAAVCTDAHISRKYLSLDILNDHFAAETVSRLGHVFLALKTAHAALTEYYDGLPRGDPRTCFFPSPTLKPQPSVTGFPLPQPSSSTQEFPKLKYTSRMWNGEDVAWGFSELDRLSTRMFSAKLLDNNGDDDVDVVVKFPTTYNSPAHKLLADHGLAPRLHFSQEVIGGYTMVVMDRIEAKTVFDLQHGKVGALNGGASMPEQLYADLKKSVELLHEANYVFGDLRSSNVLYDPTNTKTWLIDFDMVGTHNESTYSVILNDELPHFQNLGVKKGQTMRKEHDNGLLEYMQKSWGAALGRTHNPRTIGVVR